MESKWQGDFAHAQDDLNLLSRMLECTLLLDATQQMMILVRDSEFYIKWTKTNKQQTEKKLLTNVWGRTFSD